METPKNDFQQALELAKAHFQAGRLAPAEILCLEVLKQLPNNCWALELLGRIGQRIGKFASATACFRAAVSAAKNNSSLSVRLAKAEAAQARRIAERGNREGARYLLIKAWGYGFCSDLNQVLGSLMLAEMTARTPVVHWGANSLFGGSGVQDVFATFFEPFSDKTIDDLTVFARSDYFPSKWSGKNLRAENLRKWRGRHSRMAGLYFFDRSERVAVCDFFVGVPELMQWLEPGDTYYGMTAAEIYARLTQKYLRPRAEISAAVDGFYARHLADAPFVAAHARGSDKIVEQANLNEINARYFETLDRMVEGTDERIYLLTDSEDILSSFRARYDDRLVTTKARRTANQIGVHYGEHDDPTRIGVEVMQDVYLAVRARRFVGNGGSSPSSIISHLKNWGEDDCVLLSPNMHHIRNTFIHFCPSPD